MLKFSHLIITMVTASGLLLPGCATSRVDQIVNPSDSLGFSLTAQAVKVCQAKHGIETPEQLKATQDCIVRDTESMIEHLRLNRSSNTI